MKQSINIRQVGILLIMTIFANKILLMPSLLFSEVKADGIFVVAVLFLLEILTLPVFIILKEHYPNESLYEILSKKIGIILTKIIYILLIVFFFLKVLLVFSVTYVYFKQQIYKDEMIWIALISFLPVINHAVISGIRPLSRTMEIFFAVVLVGFIACLSFSLFTRINIPYMFLSTPKSFFDSIYRHFFAFGDIFFLFLIMDRIEIKKGQSKTLYKYAIIGMILVLILYFLYYSKYQVTSFMHNNALADILVFSVQFNAIGRLDIIAMITIMMITFFQMEIFSYAFSDCFMKIFPKLNTVYSVIVFDIIFCLIYYVFIGKYEIMIKTTLEYFPFLAIIINIVLPIVFLIFALLKRRENEKTD